MAFDLLLSKEQAEAVKILINRYSKIIAFQTGLGKTYTALASFEGIRRLDPYSNYRLMVCCTKTALATWKEEIPKHTDYSAFFCTADLQPEWYKKKKPQITDVIVAEYTALPKAYELIGRFYDNAGVVAVTDEMHKLKNPDSRLTRMMRLVRDSSMCTWGLTATPMLNHLEDIFFLVDFIAPGALGTEKEFMKRYVKVRFRRVGCSKVPEPVAYMNLDELSERIKKYVIHAYRSMDVRFHFLGVNLPEREELLYLRAAMGLLGEGQSNWAPRLHDLQYAADNVTTLDRAPNKDYDYLGAKEGGVLRLVKKLLSEEKAVILYSCTKRQIFRLKALLEMKGISRRIMVITGDTSGDQRFRIAKDFTLGDILLVTGAGGESLNLQISNNVIMYNLPFKVGEMIQVVGRIVRMDSTYDHMNIFVIEAYQTIDSYKRMYLAANADRIKRVVGTNSCVPQTIEVPSRNFIIKMRQELLWKRDRLKELESRAQIAVTRDFL